MASNTPDKRLFTPGPLTTSRSVKEAMLHDLGSRDDAFIAMVRSIRHRLLAIAGTSQEAGYEAIPIQGSGTFGVEAVLSSVIPASGRLLLLVNGAYGERMVQMADRLRIPATTLRCSGQSTHDPETLREALRLDPGLSHVALVHCETTTGVLNPIATLAPIVRAAGRTCIVDGMSSFGALPLDLAAAGVDFLISSANKCIEGVPGFALIIARRAALLASAGHARTLSLDLLAQWQGLESSGQFRFTPPTHALLAFDQALRELETEGGPAGRLARYSANHQAIMSGLGALGFKAYVPAHLQAPIITSFLYPDHPAFRFEEFYQRLSQRGFVIYPGKLSQVDCFRIGHIGRLFPADMNDLVDAIRAVLHDLGLPIPVPAPAPAPGSTPPPAQPG